MGTCRRAALPGLSPSLQLFFVGSTVPSRPGPQRIADRSGPRSRVPAEQEGRGVGPPQGGVDVRLEAGGPGFFAWCQALPTPGTGPQFSIQEWAQTPHRGSHWIETGSGPSLQKTTYSSFGSSSPHAQAPGPVLGTWPAAPALRLVRRGLGAAGRRWALQTRRWPLAKDMAAGRYARARRAIVLGSAAGRAGGGV